MIWIPIVYGITLAVSTIWWIISGLLEQRKRYWYQAWLREDRHRRSCEMENRILKNKLKYYENDEKDG